MSYDRFLNPKPDKRFKSTAAPPVLAVEEQPSPPLQSVLWSSAVNQQAVLLQKPGLLIAQRQALAAQMGGALGNQHLAQVVQRARVQPVTTPTIQRQPTSFAAIPQAELTALRISTIEVNVPQAEVDAVFATTGTRTSYSHGGQTVFAASIPAALQRGLTSVSGYLTNQTNALPLNTTINIALNLASHGGANTIYRFTWFVHTQNRTPANTMLIEEVGPATAIAAATTVPTGSFTVGGQTFNLRGTWNNNDFGTLQHALGLLPAAALQAATGLTFNRRSGASGTSEAGHFDPASDTIDLYDNAFPNASLRLGTATRGEHNILHEIGHALDLRVLERAWQTFNAGGQTAAGRRTFLAVRSLSGSRYIDPGGGNYQSDLNLAAARDGAFRIAAQADGVRRDTSGRTLSTGDTANLQGGVTEYSDVNYEELYAESFALYMTDRARLQAMRPRTFAYFQTRYP